ncbi:hypothetical protein/topoisomerase 1-associated factor 1 [Blumeria hordei DH14]|uniref:Topoisomerase 1-associated factor 1 n=1 Tax=Blumeria graminis f. sp. hordei (strain DH14) TaxID=546991 RepID=N1JAY8_BLUG1|nr:hypothetical protein/topoisomerase 1-associated factor 1 [Blumeria hordei DH14]
MDNTDTKKNVIDPEVRAYVSSLVTALGGSGTDESGQYVLGDDALACLRDLKRWLKLYDEKANRLDVARCLAETNLVRGDLLQILATWPESATEDKIKSKVALACLELLVPLTWPIEKDPQQMSQNHHRHIPYLQIAQLQYKSSIINFDGAKILHTATRCALPSLAESIKDRSARDEGIIKLLLYFIRNITMIAPPPNYQHDGDEAEISRSTTIDAFEYQDIFHLILTISSMMGEDFDSQDVIVMEIIFHLIKGIDAEKLFFEEEKAENEKIEEMIRLRKKEAAMLNSYKAHAPTRHNSFGTMAWMVREDARMTTISGQTAVIDSSRSLAKMDSTKRFKPARRIPKLENGPYDFYTPQVLSTSSTKHLRKFVEEFLDSSFNPLFDHIRKAIDRDTDRIMDHHLKQYFYLVNWFLQAERFRKATKVKLKGTKISSPQNSESFSLVASVLTQEMFVTLNRFMTTSYESKSWLELSASLKCFSQILLTVHEMWQSPCEQDQEIAENILNRIFYEEITHDLIASVTRTYKDQGFGYLDSVTEIAHNYLRILEKYSKQNIDLQVRSKRKKRRKSKVDKLTEENELGKIESDDSEKDDEVVLQQASHDRKFDFKRFSARFTTQGCIDTFILFTTYYNDLNLSQLKRAHRFLHRIAFKDQMSVMLFRVDIIALLYKMIKGPDSLDQSNSSYGEWDELIRQIMKKCIRKIQERPELFVEMLFSKTNSTAYYLEYGYAKQTYNPKPRSIVDLEVKGDKTWEQQISIVVRAMLEEKKENDLQWLKSQLLSAKSERKSWESSLKLAKPVDENVISSNLMASPCNEISETPLITVNPDTSVRKTSMHQDGLFRLLMKLVGIMQIDKTDDSKTSWVVPSSVSAGEIENSLKLIERQELSPLGVIDDQKAVDLIGVKAIKSRNGTRRQFEDDEDSDNVEEDILIHHHDLSGKKVSEAGKITKKKLKPRKEDEFGKVMNTYYTDIEIEARNSAKREREREKNRKIKSNLFVHDSDEETDEERDRAFFEREEKIRQRSKLAIVKDLLNAGNDTYSNLDGKPSDQNLIPIISDFEEDINSFRKKSRKRQSSLASLDNQDEDTQLHKSLNFDSKSSVARLAHHSTGVKRQKVKDVDDEDNYSIKKNSVSSITKTDFNNRSEGDDEEDSIVARPTKRRVRTGFIMESSDED